MCVFHSTQTQYTSLRHLEVPASLPRSTSLPKHNNLKNSDPLNVLEAQIAELQTENQVLSLEQRLVVCVCCVCVCVCFVGFLKKKQKNKKPKNKKLDTWQSKKNT